MEKEEELKSCQSDSELSVGDEPILDDDMVNRSINQGKNSAFMNGQKGIAVNQFPENEINENEKFSVIQRPIDPNRGQQLVEQEALSRNSLQY